MAVVAGRLLGEVEEDPAQVDVEAVADGSPGFRVQAVAGDQFAVAGALFGVFVEKLREGKSTAMRISRSGSSSVQGPCSSSPRKTTWNQ